MRSLWVRSLLKRMDNAFRDIDLEVREIPLSPNRLFDLVMEATTRVVGMSYSARPGFIDALAAKAEADPAYSRRVAGRQLRQRQTADRWSDVDAHLSGSSLPPISKSFSEQVLRRGCRKSDPLVFMRHACSTAGWSMP